ncbi:MAG: cell division protein FtsQ [Polaribacter sp.]|jgi:cell division protein FtsQ
MAKKMAVRNKHERNNAAVSLSRISGTVSALIKRLLKYSLVFSLVALCVFIFKISKESLVEQWKVTQISINNNLNLVEPRSIASILKKKRYAYLLDIDVEKLHDEIVNLEWVKQVKIRKKWPNTIELLVEEYKPIARINESVLIDSGKLISVNVKEAYSHLPQITFEPSFDITAEENQYIEIFDLYQNMQRDLMSIGIRVESLNISGGFSWTLNTESNMEIKIGRKHQVMRIERLISSLPFVEKLQQIRTVDLRYNNGFSVSKKKSFKNLDSLLG